MKVENPSGIAFTLLLIVSATTGSKKKLQIGIKQRGENCDEKSKKGDTLYLNYVGTLEDGTEFDRSSSYANDFMVTLGYGQVIKGWEQGLIGMCVGEKRKLVIPPDLAYGSTGAPPKIPPNATIIFIVELTKLVQNYESPLSHENIFDEDL